MHGFGRPWGMVAAVTEQLSGIHKAKPKPHVWPRSVPHDWRFPFEIRRVDQHRRRYVLLATEYRYADACLVADVACQMTGQHHVIWDVLGERVLYDSRRL